MQPGGGYGTLVLDAATIHLLETSPVPTWFTMVAIVVRGRAASILQAFRRVLETCLYETSLLAESILAGVLVLFGAAIVAGEAFYPSLMHDNTTALALREVSPLWLWAGVTFIPGSLHWVGIVLWVVNRTRSLHIRRMSVLALVGAYFLLVFVFVIAAPYNLAWAFLVPLFAGAVCVCNSLGGPDEHYLS